MNFEHFKRRRAKAYPSNAETLKGLFQACHESRKMIQKTYTLSFRNRLSTPIYFDFERDVLFFKDAYSVEEFAPQTSFRGFGVKEVRDQVKTVILGLEVSGRGISNILSLSRFENLETLIWENGPRLHTRPSARRLRLESLLENSWKEEQVDGKARTKIVDWSIEEAKNRLLLCD